jgi:hypothetical protein
VLLAVVSYLLLLFVVHNFTYRTRVFDGAVLLGVVLAGGGWLAGGSDGTAVATIVVGAAWFVLTKRELAIKGSERLKVRPGDRLPASSYKRPIDRRSPTRTS